MPIKANRPKITTGITIQKETGCGHLFVIINGDGNGNDPLEVFASLGKSGGCSACQNEAITRSITLGLKYGIPVQEFISELRGIKCPQPIVSGSVTTLSCADALAHALQEYVDEHYKV